MDPVARRFYDVYDDVKTELRSGDIDLAKKHYMELFSLYERMNASGRDHSDKELAFDRVTALRKDLLLAKRSSRRSRKKVVSASTLDWSSSKHGLYAVVGVLLVLGGLAVAFQPSLVGLAVFDPHTPDDLDLVFDSDGKKIVFLDGPPTTIRLTGELTSGSAKVFAMVNGEKNLVFDSTQQKSYQGRFVNTCAETCIVETESELLPLIVEVDGGTLSLEEVVYR